MTLRRKILLITGIPLLLLIGLAVYFPFSNIAVEALPLYDLFSDRFGGEYYITFLLLALFGLFIFFSLIVLDRIILARLANLGNSVRGIGAGGDFTGRVKVRGRDELANLGEEINSMIFTLEYSHQELQESEDRFRRITDNMLDMIAHLDTDGHIVYVSPSHQSILGFKEEAMVGEHFLQFVHDDDYKKAQSFISAAIGAFPMGKVEFRMKHVKDKTVWVEAVGSYLRDEFNMVSGIILSSRDITERRQAEKALKESEEKHRQIVANIEEGYYEVDTEGSFTFFNDSLSNITGYSFEELRQLGSGVLSTDPVNVSRAFQRVFIAESSSRGLVWPLQCKDEREIFVEVSVSPIRDEQEGNIVGYRGLVRDVTERQLREENIQRLNEELEQRVRERTAQLEAANKELEAFSYSVSHDLRAPLRSIDGFSTALLEDYSDKLDASGQNFLQRVRAASQRMGQLIDDLLNLSRVTRAEMSSGEVNLSLLAREIWEDLRESKPERVVRFTAQPDVHVKGDERLLRIMMENLLSNAWKFTGKKERAAIEFAAKEGEDGNGLVYYVKDDGAGFEMEYADKLFGPFQRLHTNEDYAGTGVGLATVARIVRRHGGHVWAEGAVNEGATIFFTL